MPLTSEQRTRYEQSKARRAANPGCDAHNPHFRYLADLMGDDFEFEPMVQSERLSVRGMTGRMF